MNNSIGKSIVHQSWSNHCQIELWFLRSHIVGHGLNCKVSKCFDCLGTVINMPYFKSPKPKYGVHTCLFETHLSRVHLHLTAKSFEETYEFY